MKLTVTRTGDLGDVAKKIENAAREAQRAAGKAVAVEARKALLDDVRSSRGSLRMMGGRLGVKATTDATPVNSTVTLKAKPAGPWAIVISGTSAYDVRPRRAQVLAVSTGDIVGMHAHHGRRPGRDYWTPATERLDDALNPIVERIVDAHMNEA